MRKVSDRNRQWLMKEPPLLEQDGVVSHETAGNIESYYTEKTASGLHWAIVAFPLWRKPTLTALHNLPDCRSKSRPGMLS